MNKDFFKATLLVICIIFSVGIIAWLIPGCEQGSVKIKKLKWFGWLSPSRDTTAVVVNDQALEEAANYQNDTSPLQPLLRKLKKAKAEHGYLRIAYYGDSIIEGDLITQQLRYNLQSRFGGSGIGFMPITSITANFRRTIRHSFAKNWESLSFMTKTNSDIPLGIGGFTYIPRNFYTVQQAQSVQVDSLVDSTSVAPVEPAKKTVQRFYLDTPPWVKYQATALPGGANQFDRIRLFYSHAKAGATILVSFDDKPGIRYNLNSGAALQTLDLTQGTPLKGIRLEFNIADEAHVYGISFDQPTGIFVDNYSIRGYSGMYFQRIPQQLLSQFQNQLKYDLIILQYGENVSNPKATNYEFYKAGMIKTIRHLQAAYPDVPILLISAHDRSIKQETGYVTSPDIPFLIKAQVDIAQETGCAFWNLYEAMGGKDSMQSYVKHNPAWASKDFTHFNQAGANHIADMLTEFLLKQ
jgi:lysophospholipase L1-like esterase